MRAQPLPGRKGAAPCYESIERRGCSGCLWEGTNGTALPLSTGISGFGTNVEAFLASPTFTNLLAAVTGQTIADATADQDGALSRITSWSVDMHMGTQYGILTRILATGLCLGLLTSIATATIMWWKRRPTGSTGLPGRTTDTMKSNTPRGAVAAIGVIATALAVLYPSFGVTLLLVLIIEAIVESRRNNRQQQPQIV